MTESIPKISNLSIVASSNSFNLRIFLKLTLQTVRNQPTQDGYTDKYNPIRHFLLNFYGDTLYHQQKSCQNDTVHCSTLPHISRSSARDPDRQTQS